jgi:ABC-2 type transport system permease protein
MLKYVVVSTAALLPFLVGRAAGQLFTAAAGFLVTLLVGVLLLGVQIDVWAIDWRLLVPSMTVGLIAIVSLGLAVAGLCLTTRRESWSYPEAIAGGLYLLSGAIFPPDVLPPALQPVALALPTTWWLEGVRRALLGVPTPNLLARFDDAMVLTALCVSTVVLTLGSVVIFRTFERIARERGLIDQTTGS